MRLPRPLPLRVGDQVPGALGLGRRQPLDPEAQRLELGPHHPPDRLHARKIQRAAILVHQPLEQADMAVELAVDGGRHPLLGALSCAAAGAARRRAARTGASSFMHSPQGDKAEPVKPVSSRPTDRRPGPDPGQGCLACVRQGTGLVEIVPEPPSVVQLRPIMA
jgi:hypothetical protein